MRVLVYQEMSDVFVVEMWDIKPTINDAQQEENSAGSVVEQCVKRSRNKTLGEAQEAQQTTLEKARRCTLQCKASET